MIILYSTFIFFVSYKNKQLNNNKQGMKVDLNKIKFVILFDHLFRKISKTINPQTSCVLYLLKR